MQCTLVLSDSVMKNIMKNSPAGMFIDVQYDPPPPCVQPNFQIFNPISSKLLNGISDIGNDHVFLFLFFVTCFN